MTSVAANEPVALPIESTSLEAWLGQFGRGWKLDLARWPHDQALRWRTVLASDDQGTLALLSDREADSLLLQSVESRLRRPVRWVGTSAIVIDHWLGQAAADFRALANVHQASQRAAPGAAQDELSVLQLAENASPVVQLLDATLYDALRDGASDVHIECNARGATIRFRIDGVLSVLQSVEGASVAEQVVSRLKVMASLDIGERRLPQDGRFKLRADGREVDFRLSVMPTVFGEDAVIRILDRSRIEHEQGSLTLDALGFDADDRSAIRALARQPHGLLLVTGPTGSGKTTTLYAAITETISTQDKVITIEDPVEYQLAGVVQIPVNDKTGLTFSRGLRSILRHDPDRVMVGEIRDAETAQIAVQAALTGHLVFSTVHANTAFDVIGRFMHMGLDLYNVVSALNAVVAQRLVRLNCGHCSQPYEPSAEELALLDPVVDGDETPRFRCSIGCPNCRGTGYRGRRAVAELLKLDDRLRDLIVERAPLTQIKAAARDSGLRSLRAGVLACVRRGETSFEELHRVTLDE